MFSGLTPQIFYIVWIKLYFENILCLWQHKTTQAKGFFAMVKLTFLGRIRKQIYEPLWISQDVETNSRKESCSFPRVRVGTRLLHQLVSNAAVTARDKAVGPQVYKASQYTTNLSNSPFKAIIYETRTFISWMWRRNNVKVNRTAELHVANLLQVCSEKQCFCMSAVIGRMCEEHQEYFIPAQSLSFSLWHWSSRTHVCWVLSSLLLCKHDENMTENIKFLENWALLLFQEYSFQSNTISRGRWSKKIFWKSTLSEHLFAASNSDCLESFRSPAIH